jgi:hypothetical protein
MSGKSEFQTKEEDNALVIEELKYLLDKHKHLRIEQLLYILEIGFTDSFYREPGDTLKHIEKKMKQYNL